MGVKVKATNHEKRKQKARVQANSINSFPKKPSMKPIGKNTDAKVIVIATTAKPISLEASNAAVIGVFPNS